MRAFLAIVAALIVAVAPSAFAQKSGATSWPELGFAADFPGRASVDSSGFEGMEDRAVFTVSSGSNDGHFAVTIAMMPEFSAEALEDSATRERILDGAQSESIKQGGTKLRSQRSITLDGRYGREFITTMPEHKGVEVHTRAYLEADRMYIQIAVMASKKGRTDGTRFLKSFRFL